MKQDALNQLINTLNSSIEKSVDVAGEQIPDILQQIILYKTVLYGSVIGFCLAVFVFYVVSMKVLIKNRPEWTRYNNEPSIIYMLYCFLGGIASIASLAAFFYFMPSFIQVMIAPKMFLLEYAADFLKQGR